MPMLLVHVGSVVSQVHTVEVTVPVGLVIVFRDILKISTEVILVVVFTALGQQFGRSRGQRGSTRGQGASPAVPEEVVLVKLSLEIRCRGSRVTRLTSWRRTQATLCFVFFCGLCLTVFGAAAS